MTSEAGCRVLEWARSARSSVPLGRAGASLAELLVALVILSLGGTLTARALWLASVEIEGAELGLRAALLLSELQDRNGLGAAGEERRAGPGTLIFEGVGGDELIVRFAPPGAGGASGEEAGALSGGFGAPRSWRLQQTVGASGEGA